MRGHNRLRVAALQRRACNAFITRARNSWQQLTSYSVSVHVIDEVDEAEYEYRHPSFCPGDAGHDDAGQALFLSVLIYYLIFMLSR